MAKKQEHEITRACEYCEKAQPLVDEDTMLCAKKGVVSSGYVCRKFKYDPLKRRPAPPLSIEPVDLSLDPEVE